MALAGEDLNLCTNCGALYVEKFECSWCLDVRTYPADLVDKPWHENWQRQLRQVLMSIPPWPVRDAWQHEQLSSADLLAVAKTYLAMRG